MRGVSMADETDLNAVVESGEGGLSEGVVRDRLVGHSPPDVLSQRLGRRITIRGLLRHRLQTDDLQRPVDPSSVHRASRE